jgi:hypothetical protein
MRKLLAVLVLSVVYASNAFAWGEDGHRIVCRIAFELLTPKDQTKVEALTHGFQTPSDTKLKINSFADACVFPDEARSKADAAIEAKDDKSPWLQFKGFKNQHFLNVSRATTTIAEGQCNKDCVLTGIASQAELLKHGKTDQERAQGLIFLGHFVGDIHQPLHISYEQDKGGNDVAPVTGGFYPIPKNFKDPTQPGVLNLHSVWDSGIIRTQLAGADALAFAHTLRTKITNEQRAKWLASKPLAWAQESYEITTSAGMQYCKQSGASCGPFDEKKGRTLTKTYQEEFVAPVDERLQRAGVRLAALIHESLAP